MTRINVVPPGELCDQHLLAEHRELTRIPNCLVRGRYRLDGAPSSYTLGKGHVKFFYTRLQWLLRRYRALHDECRMRGFRVTWSWPEDAAELPTSFWHDYTPTSEAMSINRERIILRMPRQPRFTGAPKKSE